MFSVAHACTGAFYRVAIGGPPEGSGGQGFGFSEFREAGLRARGRGSALAVALFVIAGCGDPSGPSAGSDDEPASCLNSPAGAFLFAADDGVHGYEPWITDGTPAGTCLLLDSTPGPDGFAGDGRDRLVFARLGGTLLFDANGGIYATDGTSEGTELRFPEARLREVVPVGQQAYVNARFPDLGGNGTYLTDGTEAGTRRLGSRIDLLDGLLTTFGQFGPSTERLFVSRDMRLRVVSTASVQVVAEFTRECDVRENLTVFRGDMYLSAAYDLGGTLGGSTRCQLWRMGPTGIFEEHRRFAQGGTQQVRNVTFAQRDGWLYYTLNLSTGGGQRLRATNGGAPPDTPTDPDPNDFEVNLPAVGSVLRVFQRAPGSTIYAIVTPAGGSDRHLVRLDGPPDGLSTTLLDTQVSDWTFQTGEDGDQSAWIGNHLFYISGGGLRRLTDDGLSDPVTLIPSENFRVFYQILPDPDHNRVFVWTLADPQAPKPLELWVAGGQLSPTHMVERFCQPGGCP